MTYSAASQWVRLFLSVASQHGQDPETWLRSRGYDPHCLADEDRVPFQIEELLFLDMHERIPDFGLVAASALQPGVFPRIDFAMLASPRLIDAFDKIIEYAPLFNQGYEFVRTRVDQGIEISLVRIAPHDIIVESRAVFSMASLAQLARNVLHTRPHPLYPEVVRFRHPRPGSVDSLQRVLGPHLEFLQPRDSVTFRDQDLQQANPRSDPNLAKILDQANATELSAAAPRPLAIRSRTQIAVALAFGVPSATEIAARMGVSERTMNRQLADAGTSFSDLLQSIRLERAQAWLDLGVTSSEVASLVFYSELAAFFRAYKRHFQRSPGADPRSARLLAR
jgi:AraC-like DNA-binding protein